MNKWDDNTISFNYLAKSSKEMVPNFTVPLDMVKLL